MSQNLSTASFALSAGDLDGMDAGELREHLPHYVARHGWTDYAESVFVLSASEALPLTEWAAARREIKREAEAL